MGSSGHGRSSTSPGRRRRLQRLPRLRGRPALPRTQGKGPTRRGRRPRRRREPTPKRQRRRRLSRRPHGGAIALVAEAPRVQRARRALAGARRAGPKGPKASASAAGGHHAVHTGTREQVDLLRVVSGPQVQVLAMHLCACLLVARQVRPQARQLPELRGCGRGWRPRREHARFTSSRPRSTTGHRVRGHRRGCCRHRRGHWEAHAFYASGPCGGPLRRWTPAETRLR